MLVSFIIPVYNGENCITCCLDSIFRLGLLKEEFEVIVVDDKSTDDTVDVIRKIQATSTYNIILLQQTVNQRQGAARNRGLSIADGKYIVYVDSDDEVDKGIIKAIELAERNKLEMVAFHNVKEDEDGNIKESVKLPYTKNEIFTGIQLQTDHPFWNCGPWAYIYRKDFLEKVNYPFAEGVLYEDADFVFYHLYKALKMGYCSEVGYKYKYNPTSTTHAISYKQLADYFLLGTRMLMLYEEIENKTSRFANSIREGGSYNIYKAFRKLFKLHSCNDVIQFYKRIDGKCCRSEYLSYHEPKIYWNLWTNLGLMYRRIFTSLVSVAIVVRKHSRISTM